MDVHDGLEKLGRREVGGVILEIMGIAKGTERSI